MKIITLSQSECAWATKIGARRRYESMLNAYTDSRNFNEDLKTSLWFDVNGAGGELAAAIALGVDWPASVNEPDTPDIIINGAKIDVKTADLHSKRLLIPDIPKTKERLDWWFLHVTGEMPTYHVWGAIKVADGINIGRYANPGKRGPVWFVSADDLVRKID